MIDRNNGLYIQQTKKLCNVKSTKSRAVGCKGFILNRFDRRRLNKLIAIFGNRFFCLKIDYFGRSFTFEFNLQRCERVSYFECGSGYFENNSEYEVVFSCTDRRNRSFIVHESLWNDLLKFRNDCIDFTLEEYCDDLLYVKTLDLGCCTLNEI